MASVSQPPQIEAAASLEAASTLAVIASSNEPTLYLAADLTIIAASESFCRAFQLDPATVAGRPIADLGAGEWAAPQLASRLRATASGTARIEAYEMNLIRKDRAPLCLLLNARKLDDGASGRVRLLLAITDVTQARAETRKNADLVREKEVLMHEVQHRIANSLQIIASVLMQNARKVQSEEARGQIQDAHHRILSIAAVQRHLAQSTSGGVTLRPYLTQLCESLGASMIHDPKRLAIVVTVDDSVVDANASVSLGLIVTELVINALKHAFPEQRRGTITVAYRTEGKNWSLSVKDDGVGMPGGGKKAKPGLGTGIVDALARHLRGRIRLADAAPGVAVTIDNIELDEKETQTLSAA